MDWLTNPEIWTTLGTTLEPALVIERFKFFVAIPDEGMGRKVAPLQKTGTIVCG